MDAMQEEKKEKRDYLGTVASIMAVLMYISYIPQIYDNLHGNKTSFIQPAVAAINCTLWTLYALRKPKKDWPIVVANVPGIIFGIITALTALFF